MFFSIFLFFSALLVAGIIFYPMAKTFDAVTRDTDMLAQWTYDPASYIRIIDREYEEHKERNAALLIIIDGMILLFVIFFIIFVPDGGVETALILLGIAILLFVVSKITPGYFRSRKEKMPKEVFISRKGLIYEGSIYPYTGFMYGCTRVAYQEGNEPVLVFSFYQITGARIYDPFEITVPIPKGLEEKGKQIPDMLRFNQ